MVGPGGILRLIEFAGWAAIVLSWSATVGPRRTRRASVPEVPVFPMAERIAEPGIAQALIEMRRARVRVLAGAGPADRCRATVRLPSERGAFLLAEAQDLYWNELSWEELTDEELVAGGHLTELVFPAFLAFVDGLLTESGSGSHPDVVEEVLTFLGSRLAGYTAELDYGADSERLIWARAMTADLIDLVLCRLYRLSPRERDRVMSIE